MEADRGHLVNEDTGVTIVVKREGAKKWSVDLDDVAAASASIPDLKDHNELRPIVQANAVIYAIPKSIREKVISLQERFGHANTEAMCDALRGDSPALTHTDITPSQVHRCLICHLSKRSRPPISPPSGDRLYIPPGYCISGDIIPVSPPASDGSTMFFLFTEVRTDYI